MNRRLDAAYVAGAAVWAAFGAALASISMRNAEADDPVAGLVLMYAIVFGLPLLASIVTPRAGGVMFLLSAALLAIAGVLAFAPQPLVLVVPASAMAAWGLAKPLKRGNQ